MNSFSSIATTVPSSVETSWPTSSERDYWEDKKPVNIALCMSSNSTGTISEGCLGWADIERPFDDIMKPVKMSNSSSSSNGKIDIERVRNWRYEEGLLRAVMDPDADMNVDPHLCLGPSVTTLMERTCKPYELVLQDCPIGTDFVYPTYPPDNFLVDTRHMRFLITEEGRVQSLAPVLKSTGQDVMATSKPFCLTIMRWSESDVANKAYLIPCRDDNSYNEVEYEEKGYSHIMQRDRPQLQFFDVYSPSLYNSHASFLIPLQSDWGYDDEVKLAYQVGVSSSVEDDVSDIDANIKIKIDTWTTDDMPDDDNVAWNHRYKAVDVIKTQGRSGIVSFTPSEYNTDGPISMSASLLMPYSIGHTTFEVSEAPTKDPNGLSYVYFTFLFLGVFGGCFILSVLANKLFCSNKRAAGATTIDENKNTDDDKAVRMMSEKEDNDFDFDDIEGNTVTNTAASDDDARTAKTDSDVASDDDTRTVNGDENDSSTSSDDGEDDSIPTANDNEEETHRD